VQIQEHEWNMPLQLSSASFYDCGSRPKDADVCEVPVAPGDLLVLGSDGLWDNLWEVQLEEAVVAAREQYQYQVGAGGN
jgi:protein phosphatase PTC7